MSGLDVTSAAPRVGRRFQLNNYLFLLAEFLSRPPGFCAVLVGMIICTLSIPMGFTGIVTYVLSVAAIVITGVVLIQGYRDTADLHAKLDGLIIALKETRKRSRRPRTRGPEEDPRGSCQAGGRGGQRP